MEIARQDTVAALATEAPATIKVFQRYGIDFCCGGKRSIDHACAEHGLDADVILEELRAATSAPDRGRNWEEAPLTELIAHIQEDFHQPLRDELPRLAAMLTRVVSRHGERYPEMLKSLQSTFEALYPSLIHHITREDELVFPAILDLERGVLGTSRWIDRPLMVLEHEHDDTGRVLAAIRRLTSGYAPPADACPTFRGLFYGLSEFERDMHAHVHLERHILFPRAAGLTRSR